MDVFEFLTVGTLSSLTAWVHQPRFSRLPPSPDFALSISPSSTTLSQGTTSTGIQVSVQPLKRISVSRDGQSLYVAENNNGASVAVILAAADLHSLGLVWDLAVQEISSEIEDSDEMGLLFALSNRGISILDASQPATIACSRARERSCGNAEQRSKRKRHGPPFVRQNVASNAVMRFRGQSAKPFLLMRPSSLSENSYIFWSETGSSLTFH